MNRILQEDIQSFAESFTLTEPLTGSHFLITGTTGLIGSTLVHCLLALDKGIEITCPVRSLAKAKDIFGAEAEKIHIVECDLLKFLSSLTQEDQFQYIIHCASPTAGSYMTDHPVETYNFVIESTQRLLDYSRKVNVKGFVYLSSLEYYGQNDSDDLISESFQGYVDSSSPRSSYPLGKRAAEYYCTSYAIEYGVPVKIARLTQTFGAGVSAIDNRVFAQFSRSVISGSDIVLHTRGESAKPYCYTVDSISAILYILLRGEKGEAYNVANDETYISIKQMAYFLRDKFNPRIKVVEEHHPEMGYAPETRLKLSSEKLLELGWHPRYNLYQMFDRLLQSLS